MIEFIEKEPFYDDSLFTGQCWMYPTFMVKDGNEYFMFNRRNPADRWEAKEIEARKAELLANKGKYFRINGFYADPLDMITEMKKRKHTFSNPKDLFDDRRNMPELYGDGFVDFHGNRNEVSAAFTYRIFDAELLEYIKKSAECLYEEIF